MDSPPKASFLADSNGDAHCFAKTRIVRRAAAAHREARGPDRNCRNCRNRHDHRDPNARTPHPFAAGPGSPPAGSPPSLACLRPPWRSAIGLARSLRSARRPARAGSSRAAKRVAHACKQTHRMLRRKASREDGPRRF
ncbi:oxidoreductase [Burkholderia pseudomallei]|nr:oxidoreductase [Burkholderia pseudomallei]RIV60018.1 oxidoreductase [Burkholderia pseudomallei]